MYFGLDHAYQKRWIPGFGLTGAITLVTGLHMTFPGQYEEFSTLPMLK